MLGSIMIPLMGLFAVLARAVPPSADTYWNVDTPIDVNDTLYAGLPQIPVTHKLIYNGSLIGRSYAHHTTLGAYRNTIYLLHSSCLVDEDAQGQETWVTVSHDGGNSWTESRPLLPQALLPNQTDVGPATYGYWCTKRVWQRAIAPMNVFVMDGEVWGISQTAIFICYDGMTKYRYGAGSIARRISPNGEPVGEPCWANQTSWATESRWHETIYGTKWGMKMCRNLKKMTAIINSPPNVLMGSDFLYNTLWETPFHAHDEIHIMEEPTHAVWVKDKGVGPHGGYWHRFWRDGSDQADFTGKVWVEYNTDPLGRNWYPQVLQPNGNEIYMTNIPDRGTKQYLGALSNGDRYMVHNPRYNASCFSQCDRSPLVVSMSRGADLTFKWTGVVRTNARLDKLPGRSKNPGFSYPSALEAEGNLIVGYSENKENIWISLVALKDLPH